MLAVGVVVQNRMRDSRYPSSVCGVVRQGRYWRGNPVKHLCQFSYWCDGKHERPAERAAWTMARNLAAMLLSTRIQVEGLGNATHYHTTSVWPPWSTRLRRQMQIGRHVKCGGLDEFIYEINWRPVFYCAECDRQSDSEGKELVGPDEKLDEAAGE